MTLNQFAKQLAQLHNETGFLLADMFDQETLCIIQDRVADLLIEAYEDDAVSRKTLLEFKNVFRMK